jgi:hypothetical protein
VRQRPLQGAEADLPVTPPHPCPSEASLHADSRHWPTRDPSSWRRRQNDDQHELCALTLLAKRTLYRRGTFLMERKRGSCITPDCRRKRTRKVREWLGIQDFFPGCRRRAARGRQGMAVEHALCGGWSYDAQPSDGVIRPCRPVRTSVQILHSLRVARWSGNRKSLMNLVEISGTASEWNHEQMKGGQHPMVAN